MNDAVADGQANYMEKDTPASKVEAAVACSTKALAQDQALLQRLAEPMDKESPDDNAEKGTKRLR